MTRDLTNFQRFAAAPDVETASYKETPDLSKFRIEMFPMGWEVFSFDQSMSATGFVQLRCGDDGLSVIQRGTISAPSGLNLRSNIDNLKGSEAMFSSFLRLFEQRGKASSDQRFFVAHESPPNSARVPGSGISSMVAATALHCAAKVGGLTVEIIARPTWAKFVCGNSKADKKEAHAALPKWGVTGDLPTNEGQRDALCVALTALNRRL